MVDDGSLAAGRFSVWLTEMQHALAGDRDADVPCGDCTACCRSSQFVHIEPDEVDTLAHIPSDVLFPAPRLPIGHVLLGYDEDGRCPMLSSDGCSIYDHRPRTCRTYDCRIFPATGVEPESTKPDIARRAGQWQFEFFSDADRQQYDAVRAAAAVDDGEQRGPTERAVLAIRRTVR